MSDDVEVEFATFSADHGGITEELRVWYADGWRVVSHAEWSEDNDRIVSFVLERSSNTARRSDRTQQRPR